VGLDVAKDIVFGAGLETNVAEIRSVWDKSAKHIAEHGTVGLVVLGLSGLVGPRDIKDVSDIG
jgi:hypothetical protein